MALKNPLRGGKCAVSLNSPAHLQHLSIKKPRFQPGQTVLHKIQSFQVSTELLIQKMPFQRLVRKIVMEYRAIFQKASEAYLTAYSKT
ncbi:hypothetical protein D9611_014609 [Ephemerocybe angulata]|uniref:Histone H2A/H2B/H3 domain-containing protein n=1 Tax=Ephemerocybe angulata TaxID=980116 RepID=A0A8H5CB17_9AGAR|nr:hypothetical protein D9611_014609 [Tulosesus angulatus]